MLIFFQRLVHWIFSRVIGYRFEYGRQSLGRSYRGGAWILGLAMAMALSQPAFAGPPYVTDDPEPTDYKHFEIYGFAGGTATRDGSDSAGGIDFNYGGAPDLQLTAVVPFGVSHAKGAPSVAGFGNVELAAKYKFLHQDDFGWDVAF